MKISLIALTLFWQVYAFATTTILDYKYGNQITGSVFSIDELGTVNHSERSCCPPSTQTFPKIKLSEMELISLKGWIADSAKDTDNILKAGSSGLGSSAGQLRVFQGSIEVNIRNIEFGDLSGGPQEVRFNQAPAARQIEKLVFSAVGRPMDL